MLNMKNNKYDKCIKQWDTIFSGKTPNVPKTPRSGNVTLDNGIQWVCDGTRCILDFGCGNGTMLFLSALYGTTYNMGVDLSQKAIESATKRTKQINGGEFNFIQGDIEVLKTVESSSFDAVVLSNIIDNLYPEDAEKLLEEVYRILKYEGKVLVKVNSFLSEEKITQWNVKKIKDNLLDDGMILWNNTTEQWQAFFRDKFSIVRYEDIYYEEYEQYNRMFCLIKKS